jgi:hypothetical protein
MGVCAPTKTTKSMKKLVIIVVMCVIVCSFGAFAQIKVASNGYVRVKTITPP